MGKNVAMLLGAGCSIAATDGLPEDMPSTEFLTDRILHNVNKEKSSELVDTEDRNEGLARNTDDSWELVREVQKFLHFFNRHAEQYFSHELVPHSKRKPTYETIFFMIDQLLMSTVHPKHPNPTLKQFLESIQEEFPRLRTHSHIWTALRQSKKFIEKVIKTELQQAVGQLSPEDIEENWSLIKELVEKTQTDEVDTLHIFTLNHDTLLEKYLDHLNDVDYDDGFCISEFEAGEFLEWKPNNYDETTDIHIYKLHGSVDAEFFRKQPHNKGIPKDIYLFKPQESPDYPTKAFTDTETGWLILGTLNKYRNYSQSFGFDLQHLFRKYLQNNTDEFLVAGYSFSDPGINNAIFNRWVQRPDEKPKMKVVDRDPDVPVKFGERTGPNRTLEKYYKDYPEGFQSLELSDINLSF